MAGQIESHKNHKGVIPIGGYAGPRSFPNAGIRVTTTSASGATTTGAIDAVLVDVLVDQFAFITIGNPAVDAGANTGYPLAAGIPYRMPITRNDEIKVRAASTGGNMWVHPVKGDIDDAV